jgi:tetratricopeptide (TPR) repeat protein
VVAAALGGLVYINTLHNPFVYDDFRTIVDNGSIATLAAPRAILLHEVTRPVVNLSYAIDRALSTPGPFGFHVTNVLLHMANVVLLFVVALRLSGDQRPTTNDQRPTTNDQRPSVAAFAAAALFAVHPLMTQAVGYISARPDVLSATLFLLAFLCGLRWMERRGAVWWLIAIVLWIAALLTKETAIVLPAVFFCYDRLILGPDADARKRRDISWKIHVPFFGAAIVAGIARLAVFVFIERAGAFTIAWRSIVDQAVVVWRYVALALMLSHQTIFHEVRPISSLFDARSIVAMVALFAVVALAWRRRLGGAIASFGFLWFVLLLLPSAALAIVDRGDAMAEHRAYLASCGLVLMAGSLVGYVATRLRRVSTRLSVLGAVAFGVILLSLGIRTVLRNLVWSDPATLWQEAAYLAPGNWLPWTLLGEALHEAGRHAEAVDAYRDALALNPSDDIEYMNLAVCLTETGRSRDALATLDGLARRVPQSPIVPIGRGTVYMLGGDYASARRDFLQLLARNPRDVTALQLLATLEERADNPAEALRRCEEIQQLMSGSQSTEECISRNRARLALAPRPVP